VSASRTAQAPTLSAECTVAKHPDYPDMHGRCRQTEDIPVHPSAPRILLWPRCRCSCHTQAVSAS